MDRIQAYSKTEEQIFEAALKVFSQKGKDGARMQEIADEAEINKAMLHYYFRSKDKLYESVFGYVFGRLMGALHEAIQEADDFKEFLRVFIDRYITFHNQNPAVMHLFVHESLAGASVMKKIKAQHESMEMTPAWVFVKKMQEAIDAGEVRPVDPFQTFMTVLGGSVFFFLARPVMSVINPALATDPEAVVEARKQHLFDLIYNGLRPAAADVNGQPASQMPTTKTKSE